MLLKEKDTDLSSVQARCHFVEGRIYSFQGQNGHIVGQRANENSPSRFGSTSNWLQQLRLQCAFLHSSCLCMRLVVRRWGQSTGGINIKAYLSETRPAVMWDALSIVVLTHLSLRGQGQC